MLTTTDYTNKSLNLPKLYTSGVRKRWETNNNLLAATTTKVSTGNNKWASQVDNEDVPPQVVRLAVRFDIDTNLTKQAICHRMQKKSFLSASVWVQCKCVCEYSKNHVYEIFFWRHSVLSQFCTRTIKNVESFGWWSPFALACTAYATNDSTLLLFLFSHMSLFCKHAHVYESVCVCFIVAAVVPLCLNVYRNKQHWLTSNSQQ